MKARQIFRPMESRSASPAQINKLLVMLSKAELIWSKYDNDMREWDYSESDAVAWIRQTLGFDIHALTQLSQGQIGACYEELGE